MIVNNDNRGKPKLYIAIKRSIKSILTPELKKIGLNIMESIDVAYYDTHR